jgi:FtsP/CotA-like multicopper oxidase with cupredoxin domain
VGRTPHGSAGVWFNVALVDGSDTPVGFTTVAQDGNTLVDSQEEPSHLLGPGNRVDVLVTGPESGELALKTLEFNQGDVDFPEEPLAGVDLKGPAAEPIEAPGKLVPPPKFEPTRGPDREYTFSFLFDPFRALINGQAFSIDGPPQATPTLDTTETWTLKNATTQYHPIHIHQGDFVVKSVNREPVDNHGQQDTVSLPPMEGNTPGEVTFEMSFEEAGDFVFHCHILDHEDAGMMAKVSVTKGGSP